MAKNIVIAKLNIDTQSLVDSAQSTAKAIEDLKEKQDNLIKKGKETSQQFIVNAAGLKQLEAAHRAQIAAIATQINEDGKLVSVKKAVKEAVKEVNNSENDYIRNNQELLRLKKDLNSNDENYEKRLEAINGKLHENNRWLEENGSQHAKLIVTMNDYKQQVLDGVNALNIFNGGFSGLVSRAQEAGGVGPLVTNSFKAISEGIGGMTKASLTFMATPLGALLAAIGLALGTVISYFKDTQEGIDKVTAVTRPLQSIFSALMGVVQNVGKFLVDAFTSPKKSMMELYEFVKQNLINRFTAFGTILEGIMTLDFKKISNGVLQAATGIENVIGKTQKAAQATGQFFDEAVKKGQKIDELQKRLDRSQANYTSKTNELTQELNQQKDIADDTNFSYAEREKAALKAIDLIKEQNKLVLERIDSEIKLVKLKMSENGFTNTENREIAEMEVKRKEAAENYKAGERDLYNKIDIIRTDATNKEIKRRQKLLDDALERQQQILSLYEIESKEKSKTLEDSIIYENEYAKQSLAIVKNQFEQKKISWLQYNAEIKKIEFEQSKNILQLNIATGKAMLDMELAKSKSLLKIGENLNEELVTRENSRLENEKALKLKQLALEKKIIENQMEMSEEEAKKGGINTITYYNEKLRLEEEYQAKITANTTALKKQRDDEKNKTKQEEVSRLAEERLIKLDQAQTEYDEKIILEDERRTEEIAKYQRWRDEDLISEEEHTDFIKSLEEESAKNKQKIAIQEAQIKLGTLQTITSALGEAFGQSKELAIAQATMNAGQAILSIWSGSITGNPLVDTAIKSVLTASTTVKTAKQIKEIQSAKKPKNPKLEKGGLFNIGGNRHSAGGTLFTGADGTQFEAERGELIGVMNRNAASHFMAFNNAFPAGGSSAPNYFASGGIVSREIAQQNINMDELALKIAEANRAIPAPVVAVQDIVNQGNSYVQVRDSANF